MVDQSLENRSSTCRSERLGGAIVIATKLVIGVAYPRRRKGCRWHSDGRVHLPLVGDPLEGVDPAIFELDP